MSHALIKLYNSYFFNSIDLISFSNENFKQLLINYSKYLFKISILHNNIYLEYIFNKRPPPDTTFNPINEIYNNMKNVMRFYRYFPVRSTEKIDTTILIFYCELIIKSVFVIFQYYYLYNKLGKEIILQSTSLEPQSFDLLLQNYKITLTKKEEAEEDLPKYDSEQKLYSIAETILEKNNKKVNTKIATFIEEEVNKIIQEGLANEQSYNMFILNKIKYLLTNSTTYYDIRSHDIKKDTLILKYTILYSIIIIEFNKLFYNRNETDYIRNPVGLTKHVYYENMKKLLLNDEKSFLNDLKKILFEILTQLYKINQKTTIIDKNTYITIPQYEGICWFISFLTALTYEIKTIVLDDLDKITPKTDYIIIFNTLVYYIINNVTKDFRTYNVDDMESNCNIFTNFKKYPILFLKKLINDHNYIFYSILNKQYGIMQMHYSIIKMFYSFLNIHCLYVYKIKDKYFKLKDFDIDYDIIIIDNHFNYDYYYYNSIENMIDITDDILNKKDSIIYNKNKYELDYLLHLTDIDKTGDKYSHCISAIHYNDEEYYYNSASALNTISCKKDKSVRIPCSLIKEKWKNKIDTNTCYKLQECAYNIEHKDTTIDPKINDIIRNSIYYNMCFTKDTHYITCYVKI